jgi:hypothetical protein
MFHFPAFPPHALCVQARVTGFRVLPGFPIRKSSDHSSVDSSPRHIAASHVLHRLLVPRHPPCALNNLATKMLASTVQFSTYRRPRPTTPRPDPAQSPVLAVPRAETARRRPTPRTRPPPEGDRTGPGGPSHQESNCSLRTQQRATRPGHHQPPRSTPPAPLERETGQTPQAGPSGSTRRKPAAPDRIVSVPRPMSNQTGTLARPWPWTHPQGAGQTLLRKEVIQPHLPVRLPCYDFVPIAGPTFDGSLPRVGPPASGVTDFRDVTGGVYKARERIHRSIADLRLLATPTSRGRVADPDPN